MGDDLEANWDVSEGEESSAVVAAVAAKGTKGKGAKKGKKGAKGTKRPRDEEPLTETEKDEEQISPSADASQAPDEAEIARLAKKKEKFAKLKEKKRQKAEVAAEAPATANDEDGDGSGEEEGARDEAAVEKDAVGKKSKSAPRQMPPVPATASKQAAYLWKAVWKALGDTISDVERRRPWLHPMHMVVAEGFKERTDERLPDFIKATLPEWATLLRGADRKQSGTKKPKPAAAAAATGSTGSGGGPAVLILCSGALRCTEVIKVLSNRFHCPILKLFARHFKLEAQQKELTNARKGGGAPDGRRRFPIAVGTPGRVQALVQLGALAVDEASLVILDMHRDVKGRCILDMADVSREAAAFVHEAVGSAVSAAAKAGATMSAPRIALY